MPCWTVRQSTLVLKVTNREQLLRAIASLGWSYQELRSRLEVNTGRIVLTIVGETVTVREGYEYAIEELKMQYGFENVKTAAKLTGWDMSRFSFNSQGELEGELSRESL